MERIANLFLGMSITQYMQPVVQEPGAVNESASGAQKVPPVKAAMQEGNSARQRIQRAVCNGAQAARRLEKDQRLTTKIKALFEKLNSKTILDYQQAGIKEGKNPEELRVELDAMQETVIDAMRSLKHKDSTVFSSLPPEQKIFLFKEWVYAMQTVKENLLPNAFQLLVNAASHLPAEEAKTLVQSLRDIADERLANSVKKNEVLTLLDDTISNLKHSSQASSSEQVDQQPTAGNVKNFDEFLKRMHEVLKEFRQPRLASQANTNKEMLQSFATEIGKAINERSCNLSQIDAAQVMILEAIHRGIPIQAHEILLKTVEQQIRGKNVPLYQDCPKTAAKIFAGSVILFSHKYASLKQSDAELTLKNMECILPHLSRSKENLPDDNLGKSDVELAERALTSVKEALENLRNN